LPTILDLVGLPAPEDVQGRTLGPLLSGSGESGLPDSFVVETRFRDADKLALYAPDFAYIENRDGWPGVNSEELQARGAAANGKETDQLRGRADVADAMRSTLRTWEESHPRAEPVEARRPLSPEELRQLRSIGYVE
jgi:arylsulfatase A-like enzyme